MTLLTCDLDDFESYDDLMKSYFIRVKAVWVNESSEWTNQSTFQPYESKHHHSLNTSDCEVR